MTAEQMLNNFQVELNKYSNNELAQTEDKLYYLNKAQEKFVEQRFNGANYTRRGFQQSQQIVDELKPIYLTNVDLSAYYPGVTTPDGVEMDRADLPADHMYFISSNCEMTRVADPTHLEVNTVPDPDVRKVVDGEASDTNKAIMKIVQGDDIWKVLDDPFNKPTFTKVLIDINRNYLDIYTTNRAFVSSVSINYIREPLAIAYVENGDGGNQDCELPDYTHNEIVELAVRLYLQQVNTDG